MLDWANLLKYLLEGLAVAVAAFVIPSRSLALREVVLIALTSAAVFAVLDVYAPEIGRGARLGSGLGIGLAQVGGTCDLEGEDYAEFAE